MHINRFLSTRIERADYQVLLDKIRAEGLLAMCTPFDEESVDIIVDMGFDIIKIASCSAADWPLIEKISDAGLPVIASTAGLDTENIDDLVSHFEHRGVDFALMHCVGIYPTPDELCNLNQIDALKRRYPGRVIGWSMKPTLARELVLDALLMALLRRRPKQSVIVHSDQGTQYGNASAVRTAYNRG